LNKKKKDIIISKFDCSKGNVCVGRASPNNPP
jgi:hypothetical protein